jgi:hypothetical protein
MELLWRLLAALPIIVPGAGLNGSRAAAPPLLHPALALLCASPQVVRPQRRCRRPATVVVVDMEEKDRDLIAFQSFLCNSLLFSRPTCTSMQHLDRVLHLSTVQKNTKVI